MKSHEAIVTDAEGLDAVCRRLERHACLGFDTEFIGEQSYTPELCLIQVASSDELVLIDPLAVGDLAPFWNVLCSPERTVIVHAAREEIRVCHRSCGRLPGRLVDLQLAAALLGETYPIGHAALVNRVLNRRVHKGETLTDWRKRPLSTKQVQYAYDDVRHLMALWSAIERQLVELGRTAWLDEEVASLVRHSLETEPGVERWRKLSGLTGLDSPRLAVARALFEWRERKAARQNRPVRTVVRDDLLVEIARRCPNTEADVELLRGLARKELPEVLAVVREARNLPQDEHPAQLPREVDPPQLALLVGVMVAVLGDFCCRQHLAVNLTATNSDLRALVKTVIAGEELPSSMPLGRGWRAEFVTPHLRSVLVGERKIRIADPKSPSPLDLT